MNTASAPARSAGVDNDLIQLLIQQHLTQIRPALERLWDYYRNELDFQSRDAQRSYRAAQARGLPRRLTHAHRAGHGDDLAAREIVVENDIAWRIHTLVDFMFGKPVGIQSLADDPARAELIERVLQTVFDANGGVAFFQDAALLGSIYGFVDLLVRPDGLPGSSANAQAAEAGAGAGAGDRSPSGAPSNPSNAERVLARASLLQLETVEALRAIPVLNPGDYRRLDAYVLHYTRPTHRVDRDSVLARLVGGDGRPRHRQATVDVTEHWTADEVRVYHDNRLVRRAANAIGRLPVVHVQNLPQPFYYEGLSEVEPLIPLQDELNTRLSDRANRVTFQSFKMYLGKGIENFLERPVAPGQMWTTDNPDAQIEAFGGDAPTPSEEAHINEVREAMDKTSAVTAVAAGLLRNKVGNLTSENALRIVMMGLLARTEKKRLTYGQGIERLCELILHTLDVAGALSTDPDERRVRLHWQSPIPENTTQRLRDAEIKARLGVPRDVVLAELGYDTHQRQTAAEGVH